MQEKLIIETKCQAKPSSLQASLHQTTKPLPLPPCRHWPLRQGGELEGKRDKSGTCAPSILESFATRSPGYEPKLLIGMNLHRINEQTR